MGDYQTCFKFNDKKLNSNKRLLQANRNGLLFGYQVFINTTTPVWYHIGDNSYEPVTKEFIQEILPGTYKKIILEKIVQTTLGPPYNPCIKSGDVHHSDFFKETLGNGYTYRQVN